jgi:tight adherence protein C
MNLQLAFASDLLYWSAILLAGLAIFIVARTTFEDEDAYKASETLDEADASKDNKKESFILKYAKPFFKRYFVPIVNGMKNKKRLRDKYKRKLASAGLTDEFSPDEFFAYKLSLIVGFPIVYLLINKFLEMNYPVSYAPILGVIGFFYPDIWVNGQIEKRKKDVVKNMPFIVDMLALSVEAGLDFVAAMNKVIEKAPPSALSEEFEIMIKEIKIGASRAEALRSLAWRIDVLQISSFTATLIAADSVGASIGPILKSLAGDMRQKRSSEVEKEGSKASTKILFPMMLFILPAVGLVILAPVAIMFLTGGG